MWFHRKKHASDEKKKIKKRWSAKRKGILAIVLVLFLVSGGVLTKLVIYPTWFAKDTQEESRTMEGYVSKGNIEMTTTVSGTTTNGATYQLYDLNLTGESESGSLVVSKVNVSEGDTVKKGSTVLTLTQSSVDQTRQILESAVESYQIDLVQAKVDYEEAVAQAKSDYRTNLSLLSTAALDYQNSLDTYEAAEKSAKKDLTAAQKTISEMPETITSYQKKIKTLKKKITSYQQNIETIAKKEATAKKTYESKKAAYDKLQKEYENLDTIAKYLESYNGKSNVTEAKKEITSQLTEEKTALASAKTAYEKVKKSYEELQTKKAKTQEEQTKAKGSLSSFKQKVTESKTTLSEAKENLKSYRAAYYEAKAAQTKGKVSAKETYAQSMSTYQNASSIYEATLQSAKDTLQSAKDNASSAKARKKAFEKMITGNTIKAMQDGTITAVGYSAGDTLSTTTSIATYSDSSSITIPVTVDQADMQYIAVGDSVSVSLSSSREPLTGTVASMETTSSSESVSSVTYIVNVTVDNASGSIRSDDTASVSFTKYTLKDVLYVPVSAVTEKSGKSYVTAKLTDGNTRKVEVKTGEDNGQFIELKSGLKEGDTYVVDFKN